MQYRADGFDERVYVQVRKVIRVPVDALKVDLPENIQVPIKVRKEVSNMSLDVIGKSFASHGSDRFLFDLRKLDSATETCTSYISSK